MTRKDFVGLARELREIRPEKADPNYKFWRRAVGAVGAAGRKSNDRFDWHRFKEASGIDLVGIEKRAAQKKNYAVKFYNSEYYYVEVEAETEEEARELGWKEFDRHWNNDTMNTIYDTQGEAEIYEIEETGR